MELPPPHPEDAARGEQEGWRTVVFITWAAVLVSVLVIAVSSRTIGRPIWWLGTSPDPAPRWFTLIPTAIITAPMVVAARKPRWMRTIGVASSVALLVSALPDINNSPGVATAIVTVGTAALVESIAVAIALHKYR